VTAVALPATGTRGRAEGILCAAGGLVLVGAALPVDADSVSGAETAVFGVLNGTDVLPFALVWPVMQLGNVLVVPAATRRCAGGGSPRDCWPGALPPTSWRRW
jgi:undecaprenyl-diphosphatase